ncbi:MAG: sigma-54-dependent Fis family transcriptional regulator [Alistipes sp.]|nr:sigma-54-dependent Fis family transcriptional regulator [Alistipes sp.]MBQ6691684.1 sigma-54-dependent Fis family transcriptional regulator [Rikenellaceae bacterium]
MAKAGKLLIVDDNRSILSAVKLLTESFFDQVLTLPSPNTLISTLQKSAPDVVLLDMNFHAGINTGNEGLYWLKEVLAKFPETKVVLFTAYADIELAVRAMKEGAFDFVVKPWDNAKLIATLQNAYKATKEKAKKGSAKPAPTTENRVEMYWGESAEMKRIRQVIERVAITDANILLTGENGTGKEVLAREIHRQSARCRKAMVSLDMGAIPDTLFESELFGHTKGAFTDARTDREGKFETANGSTLFMDEIGNLPLHLQAKMLAVLQNRAVTRLGANEATSVDIRLISATNRDLHEAVAKGEFRQDLLFRINTIHIHIPPLRNRKEDIVPLAERFIERYAQKYGKADLMLSGDAAEKLKAHSWEGNIRELQNTIEKAVIMCDGDIISPDHLELHTSQRPLNESQTLEEMERQTIANAIAQCGGNLSQVAQQLGITRQTLYNKIKRYGL